MGCRRAYLHRAERQGPAHFHHRHRGRTFKVVVGVVLQQRPGAKVDDLHLQRSSVHHDVLVLNVSVDDAVGVDEPQRLHHLPEQPVGGGAEASARAAAGRPQVGTVTGPT